MDANGWFFTDDIISKASWYEDTCSASQNPQIPETWYGFNDEENIGSASKYLKGKSSGILIYSNCFEHRQDEPDNWVQVNLNEVVISQATSGEVKELNFDYEENDVLTFKEGYGIIKIHQLGLDCGGKRNIIQYFMYLVAFNSKETYRDFEKVFLVRYRSIYHSRDNTTVDINNNGFPFRDHKNSFEHNNCGRG